VLQYAVHPRAVFRQAKSKASASGTFFAPEELQILLMIGQFCRLRLYLFLVHTLYFSGCCIYPIQTIGLVPIILSKAGLLFFMWILGDHWKLGKNITQTAKRSGVWNFCERKAFGIFRASCRF